MKEVVPVEPSHRYLRACLGIEALGVWHRANEAEITERNALQSELQEAWNRLGWTLSDSSFSDAELLAGRAALMPKQRRLDQLRADLDARYEVYWAAWEKRNPKSRDWDS